MTCLFGHKWGHCKCLRCGKLRDKQHNWIDCKCSICGKIRNEGHKYSFSYGDDSHCTEKCRLCGEVKKTRHKFVTVPNQCYEKCENCGKRTVEKHSFTNITECKVKCEKCGIVLSQHKDNSCICSVCGESVPNGKHKWGEGCKCTLCGKEHDWEPYGSYEHVVASGMQYYRCRACGEEKAENAGNIPI